ncbi:MAG: YraN family protein [Bacteroidales bacterium]|nr:YraN family protein [Bacteroidales bacterium]
MASHNELGKKGEEIAEEYLINLGYQIIETNWRFQHKEIDIIARDNNYLVIVEVKTRSNKYFSEPEEAVNFTKQNFLIEAAEAYIEKNELDTETRFDIVSISFNKTDTPVIKHIKEAYLPSIN